MNDLVLMRKNLFRKPVRTILLVVSIMIAFAILCVMLSFNDAVSNFRTLPTRMVTLSKINFTEALPMAHYDRIARTEGVAVATHMNWFGGYFGDQRTGFLPVFAVDPETYFQVYSEDLQIPAEQRDAFFNERTRHACRGAGGGALWLAHRSAHSDQEQYFHQQHDRQLHVGIHAWSARFRRRRAVHKPVRC